MTHSLLDHALEYARRGWHVFPLLARGKTPVIKGGFKVATTDETTIRDWWARWPDANIGLRCGEASGVYVVDVDRHSADGMANLEAMQEHFGAIPETVVCYTPTGGKHLYFRHFKGARNTANERLGIDSRGEGGYVLLPPSVHPSGGVYAWDLECDPEDTEIADLPDWLRPGFQLPALTTTGNLAYSPVSAPKPDIEVPAGIGGRNVAAASIAGQCIDEGMSLAEVHAKLLDWNRKNDAPLSDDEITRTVASVGRTHVRKNPERPLLLYPEAVPVIEEPTEEAEPAGEEFPDELLQPPGFVGELVKWMNETAFKPQPILALANALAFYGAVIGRKIRTPDDLRTNLYCLGVGASGSGKDHSRKSVKRLCEAAGLTEELLGGEDISSDAAILQSVAKHKTVLFQLDEIGHFIAGVTSKYSKGHVKAIAPTFTKLFTSANTTFIGKEYAGGIARQDIDQPNVCLYGTTVPDRLYEGLTPSEITDGFLGRMLVFITRDDDPVERDVGYAAVPRPLVDHVMEWWSRRDLPEAEGNIASVRQHTPITATISPEAQAEIVRFRNECRELKAQSRRTDGMDALWSRAGEHAKKVALTIACGVHLQSPRITGDIMAWANRLVSFVIRDLIRAVKDNVAGSDYERNLQRVQRMVRDCGIRGVSRAELLRKCRTLSAKTLGDLLQHLVEGGDVEKVEIKTTGRPKQVYRIKRE